jgi:hypothetical protein
MDKQQIKALLSIKSIDDIKSLDITHEYTDDHQPCAEVQINGIAVEFLWYDDLGFLQYYDESPKAAAKLLQSIKFVAFAALEELSDEWDEEMKQMHSELSKEF